MIDTNLHPWKAIFPDGRVYHGTNLQAAMMSIHMSKWSIYDVEVRFGDSAPLSDDEKHFNLMIAREAGKMRVEQGRQSEREKR